MSSGDLEDMLIKAGESVTKEGLKVEKATGGSITRAALLQQKHYRKDVGHAELHELTEK